MITGHTLLENRRPERRISLRLFGFVLASMALHAIILLSQHTPFKLSRVNERTMQVTLDMLTPIASPVATKQVENKVTSTKPRKPEQSIKQTNTISASKSIAQKQTTDKSIKETQPLDTTAVDSQPPGTATAETTTTTEALSDEQRRSSLNQLLTQALAKHFHYPMLARKRGWQGEVLLAFTLSTSGAITDARIAHGSGYSSLDHAALKSLNLVAHIGEQLTQELNFELPVIYRLNGG